MEINITDIDNMIVDISLDTERKALAIKGPVPLDAILKILAALDPVNSEEYTISSAPAKTVYVPEYPRKDSILRNWPATYTSNPTGSDC